MQLVRGSYPARVIITDLEGVSHTVQVTASTLYEVVALGIVAIRGHEWVGETGGDFTTVRVSVTPIPVEHTQEVHPVDRENRLSARSA
jgi:hypothetical protein